MSKSDLFTLAQAAEYLNTSASTVYWQRRMGRLPFWRLGRRLVIEKTELDEFVRRQTETAKGKESA